MAYFLRFSFAKDTLQMGETVFSIKYYRQQSLTLFPNLQFLISAKKTLNSGAKNNIFMKNFSLICNQQQLLSPLALFEKLKFFSEKKTIFVQKNFIFRPFREIILSSHLLRQLYFDLEKFKTSRKILEGKQRKEMFALRG